MNFRPISNFFVIEFVTLRHPMCRHALEPRRAREAACGRVLWLKFSTKSCCIPSWPHSSRGLSCSRRRPGSAKAVIEFRVGARRRSRRSANPATPLHTLQSSGATWHPVATGSRCAAALVAAYEQAAVVKVHAAAAACRPSSTNSSVQAGKSFPSAG